MSTINGKPYQDPRNINLKGSALGTGLLRWNPAVFGQSGSNWSTNPFSSDDYGLYINSSNQLVFSSLGSAFVLNYPIFSTETIAAGGTSTALSLTKTVHYIDADAGGDTFTLAAGTTGQTMYILMKSSTGTATITPSALAGGTSVTFNAIGDSVVLQYMDSKWFIVGGNSYTIV